MDSSTSKPPRAARRNRLADLQAEVQQVNTLNKIDARAEHTMMASHKGSSRLRRGVVETEDGRFITDTRDFAHDEGVVDHPDDNNSNIINDDGTPSTEDNTPSTTTSSTTTTTTTTTGNKPIANSKKYTEILSSSIIPIDAIEHISMNLEDSEYKIKKPRQSTGVGANHLVGDERQVLLHEKKVAKIQHTTSHIGEATGTFTQDVPNEAAVYQLSKDIQKSKEKADKIEIKKRSRNINTTLGVNFANEEFNQRLEKDYQRAASGIRSALERGSAD